MASVTKNKDKFTVILEEEETGFSVHCPALPGCVSQGDDRLSAMSNIREAIEAVLETHPEGSHCDASAATVSEEIRLILTAREEDGLRCYGVSIEHVEVVVKVLP